MKTSKVLKFIGFGILGLGFVTLAVYVTMSLWNCLIPELFHGPIITFWQTAGLFILSKLLLSGFTHGGCGHHKRMHSKFTEGECTEGRGWWKHYNTKESEDTSK